MSSFDGKVAVVTGGNSGIGLAIAQEFAKQGARVAIFGRNADTLAEAEESIEGETLAIQGDITNIADIDRLFTAVKEQFGRVDTLIANAGGATFSPFTDVSEEMFDAMTNTNFKGVFFTVQKALPLMSAGATVVLVSSVAGTKGVPNTSVYAGTKAAVRSLARTLTSELAPLGIRINVLSPGPIETPIFTRIGIPADEVDATKEAFTGMVPLGRFGSTDEMASAALFLASDASAFVAGADLAADGGLGQV